MTTVSTKAAVLADQNISERSQSLRAALGALVLGLTVVFGVGFAYPEALHNAAHDSRHASGFPCH
ncbi:MAG: cobalt transporter [Hyphomicrobiales bacterium]|nr:MAG: cobalt transporter [Hyphomicrobiales bacterium]